MTSVAPSTPEEVAEEVRRGGRLLPVGGGTKPGLSRPPDGFAELSLKALSGVREYEPAEYTITALAGTPVAEVASVLAEQGQYLPFDPPFVDAGSTLGGTVATGFSGSGRQRFGGIRDFLIGVSLVDGEGRLVRGGGKVVKNAAGFDLPKLVVGSLGTLGVLTELTFKVFPRPRSRTTLSFERDGFAEAHGLVQRLASAPLDLDALDLERHDAGWRLLVRLGGEPESFAARARRVESLCGSQAQRLDGFEEEALWVSVREAAWACAGRWLVRVPIAATLAPDLERGVEELVGGEVVARRYAAGSTSLLLDWLPSLGLDNLEGLVARHGLAAQLLRGDAPFAVFGEPKGLAFYRRIRSALDPAARFPDLRERMSTAVAVR